MTLQSEHDRQRENLSMLLNRMSEIDTPDQLAKALNSYMSWGHDNPIPHFRNALKAYLETQDPKTE